MLSIMNETILQNQTAFDISLPERIIEVTLLLAMLIVTLIGNVSLWIIILSSRPLHTTCNALVLCLSSADLLVSLVDMPVVISVILHGPWLMQVTEACVVLGFLTMVTFVASVMSLANISINRWVELEGGEQRER